MIIADIWDILSSPVWTVLATILAAVAIGVTIWLSRRNKTRKDLSREISVTELVSVHRAASDAKGRIKIYFDDEQIQQVHLVEVTFKNIGNVPIEPGDFVQPIMVELGEGASVLTVDVVETKPSGLRAEADADQAEAVLAPLLLNQGDCLTLKILARNLRQEPQLSYRIVGITEMADAAAQRQSQGSPFRMMLELPALVGAAAVIIGFVLAPGLVALLDQSLNEPNERSTRRGFCIELAQEGRQQYEKEEARYIEERAEGKAPGVAPKENVATRAFRNFCLK